MSRRRVLWLVLLLFAAAPAWAVKEWYDHYLAARDNLIPAGKYAEAITSLQEAIRLKPIDIETYSIAESLTGHLATEDSELGAKFSTPIALGLLLVFGQSDASIYKKQYVADPRVQSIARKVKVRVNPERDKVYPGQRGALVTVKAGGQSCTHEVTYPRGEPENPLSDDEMAAKFEKNASTLYTAERVNRMRAVILDIENRHVRELTSMLRAPGSL